MMPKPRPGKLKDTTLTPLWLLKKIGVFDYDPCAYQGHATAKNLNVWPSDGLSTEWFGTVWCNPPYSDPSKWVDKMIQHNNGVMLVLASTDTKWFHNAAKHCTSMLFFKGRPKFNKTDGSSVQLMRATVLIEFGTKNLLKNCDIEGLYVVINDCERP